MSVEPRPYCKRAEIVLSKDSNKQHFINTYQVIGTPMNTTEFEKTPEHFDVSNAIDKGQLTNLQRWTYVLASLAIIIDGFDGQMIGYAIPQIMNEWGTTRAAFSLAVASGLAGMAIGSLSAGVLADKFGRKPVLIGSILLFGTSTMLISFATDVPSIEDF